jgi:putative peptide zinc metalloprotease protein
VDGLVTAAGGTLGRRTPPRIAGAAGPGAAGSGAEGVAGSSPGARTPARLAALREDLRIEPAAPGRDGSPAWTLHDPVGNRFFRIGWLEFALLARWRSGGDPAALLAQVCAETPLQADATQLEALEAFLRQHQLLRADTAADTARLLRTAEAARESPLAWLLHHYLFFRVPLIHPARGLARTLPWVQWLYSRGFRIATATAAVVGLMLAARQWDTFTHTLAETLSPTGLAGWALALVFAKTLHELGHAWTATRYGLRVSQMGVAFIVLWPMLYTDTGEAWKLADRGRRFRVAAAGIAAEFALAAWATLAWSLTADGDLKSALFFLATTSWVLTLAINASPFMRFDGYFLLSDALDLPNLHARAGALARAWMRRTLLGWDEPDPEPFPPGLRRGLIAFALVTWVYRLLVFIAIAVAVYHVFFKLLGILLFVVEIVWFVLRPVGIELREWVRRREAIAPAWRIGWLLAITLVLGALAWPWRTPVRAEGWLHAERQQLVYSPLPARIAHVREPGPVRAGELLVRLDSPDVRSRLALSVASVDALALQLDRTVGRSDGHEQRATIAEQLAGAVAELSAQQAELQRLELRAAFDGVLGDHDPQVQPGAWVNATQPIAMLHAPDAWVVDALVEQQAIGRFEVGAPARFHRRGQWEAPLAARVVAIDGNRTQALPHPMLAAEHGGRVPTLRQPDGRLVPRDGLYRVRLRLDALPPADARGAVAAGTAVIEAEPRSLLRDWATGIAAVLVRESGF